MRPASLAKLACPDVRLAMPREQLFSLLEDKLKLPVVWVNAPAGSGKTTLVASYLKKRGCRGIWYQMDEEDSDLASFFYYLRLAASQYFPKGADALPLLTPEYLHGIPVFARRYFQTFFALLSSPAHPPDETKSQQKKQKITKKQPDLSPYGYLGNSQGSSDLFLVVLDNYQMLPEDSQLHAILASNLERLPECIRFILISRSRYPKQFVRLKANNMLSTVDWEDLRFSPEECGVLVRKCRKHLSGKASQDGEEEIDVSLLYSISSGWAAGLVMLAQEPNLAQKITRSLHLSKDISDYFAQEVCSFLDKHILDFLLKTSHLPKMTAELAAAVSKNRHSEAILNWLRLRNCFIEARTLSQKTYEYHPLFKDFLQRLAARSLDQNTILEVKRTAAEHLVASGETAEAVQLFLDADETEEAARLIIRMAPEMIAQGRGHRLEKWLSRIPEPVSLENPAISYWLGICRMHSDPDKALSSFHRAYEGFRTMGDHANMILSWSGAANTLFFKENDLVQLDSWMQRLQELMEKNPSFPSSPRIAAEVISGVARGSIFRDFSSLHATKWFQQALEQIESNPVPENLMCLNSLLSYNIYEGNTARVSHLFSRMAPFITESTPAPVRIHWCLNKAFYLQAIEGLGDKCLAYVKQGLALSRETGIYALNLYLLSMGVHAGLAMYDIKTSEYYLKELAGALQDMDYPPWFIGYHYFFSSCIQLFLLDNADSAHHYIQEAVKVAKNIGDTIAQAIALINRANIYLEMNKLDQARLDIDEARQTMPGRENIFEFMCALTEARYFLSQNKQSKGLDVLGKALSLGRRQGYYNHPNWMRSAMSMLCSRALEHGIEKSYVQSLIRRRGLYPCDLEKTQTRIWIENWPYPVHIYTLGRFELFLDSQKIQFSGKIQKKPLEMLKVLIALGGEDIAWEQLTDTIYPESDGDRAYYSFKSMLHLLRKLLEVNDALILQGGRLSLNPRYCYTDLQHFSHLSDRVEKLYQSCRAADKTKADVKENRQQILDAGRQVLSVYQGDFLPGEEAFWAVEPRERTRSRLGTVVQAAGDLLEKENKFMEAAKIYEQAVEKNQLQEFFYRRLMVCLHKTGRRPEAHAVYQKCCRTLSRHLGVKPSPETESTYKSLMRS